MFKKVLGISLAGVIALSSAAAIAVSADDSGKTPGGFGHLKEWGKENKTSLKGNYQKLMLAMPGCWINDKTETNPNGANSAGVYWWTGFDTPDNIAGHGWPGYLAPRVTDEEDVTNLFASYVPAYGNGEDGNATMIVWNNYIDGGTIGAGDPFYEAAAQGSDFPCQYYSKNDLKTKTQYEKLFRYIYAKQAANNELDGAEELLNDLDSKTFWEDINKYAAEANEEDWDSLSAKERTFQIDNFLDNADFLDFSEFGDYASNFFNEDLSGSGDYYGDEDIYDKEDSNGDCLVFNFDKMVYVVDLNPANISKNALSQKLGFAGDVYFYYGNGDYGTWPTKELNEKYNGVSGNFSKGAYIDTTMQEIMDKYNELHADDPEETTDAAVTPVTPGGNSNTNPTSASNSNDSSIGTATNDSPQKNDNQVLAPDVFYIDGENADILGNEWSLDEVAVEDGKYVKTIKVDKAQDKVTLNKITFNGVEYTTADGKPLVFNLTGAGEFRVVLDPETKTFTVEGDIVEIVTAADDKTIPAPDKDDAESTQSEATADEDNNGAIQTGQSATSFVVISILVLVAGFGAVYFARKKVQG